MRVKIYPSKLLRRPGFTLVEMMIVVVIVGMLAVIALPGYRRVRMHSQNTRFISDLRMFTGACETYILTVGDFPPNGTPGVLPTGLEAIIKRTDYEITSPIGGSWNILSNSSGVTFAVGAAGINASDEQLELMDRQHDDGSLTTGQLRKIGDGYYRVITE